MISTAGSTYGNRCWWDVPSMTVPMMNATSSAPAIPARDPVLEVHGDEGGVGCPVSAVLGECGATGQDEVDDRVDHRGAELHLTPAVEYGGDRLEQRVTGDRHHHRGVQVQDNRFEVPETLLEPRGQAEIDAERGQEEDRDQRHAQDLFLGTHRVFREEE
nr:hypothetical protein [Corynebacterium sp.]